MALNYGSNLLLTNQLAKDVGHLSSANLVTNVPTVVIDPPIGARLHEVGSSGFESKSSNHTERRLHPPLPVQTQYNQVTNCHKQLYQPYKNLNLLEALYQLMNRNAVEPVENPNSLGFYNRLFWSPNPTTGGDLSWT